MSISSRDQKHHSLIQVVQFKAEKITDIKIEENWLVYIQIGLREAQTIHDNYRKWKSGVLEDIRKGIYKSRIDALLKNRMPAIELKAAVDEFENKSETDPHDW